MQKFLGKTANFFLSKANMNPCVIEAEYAVRGAVPIKAAEIETEIKNNPNHTYPFKEMTYCNIGNPQNFNQKPISFNRIVISCVLNPQLLKLKEIHPDVKVRVEKYLKEIISAGSYTESLGIQSVRRSVANYIAKHDEVDPPQIDKILLTEGASQGVHLILQALLTGKQDGVMIPVPQYPLYSASITLNNGTAVPYYLDESKGWQFDLQDAERAVNEAKKKGLNVKAIAVINPGNPTGAIFNDQTITSIIKFAVKNKLILIADEVYRDNIYKPNTKFASFRKVLNKLDNQLKQSCQLVSLNSISKGLLGQCGLRGGYMELYNLSPEVQQQLLKLKSVFLCSNSVGQIMVDLMVNPPLEGVSKEITQNYLKQRQDIFNSLKERAELVTEKLNKMRNISCVPVEGAMYAFPSIKFSPKAIQAAGDTPVDLFYCLEVLKNTGIVLVPGSGFHQKPGTYHFRITTLILPISRLRAELESFTAFNEKFHQKYE